MSMTNGVYELILRPPDGRKCKTLVWLPNESVRQEYYQRAAQRGLELIEIPHNEKNV